MMKIGKEKDLNKLEKELNKVEKELKEYLVEEEEKKEKDERRKAKKWEKERRWEMMKWITKYIEENKVTWEERDKERRDKEDELGRLDSEKDEIEVVEKTKMKELTLEEKRVL